MRSRKGAKKKNHESTHPAGNKKKLKFQRGGKQKTDGILQARRGLDKRGEQKEKCPKTMDQRGNIRTMRGGQTGPRTQKSLLGETNNKGGEVSKEKATQQTNWDETQAGLLQEPERSRGAFLSLQGRKEKKGRSYEQQLNAGGRENWKSTKTDSINLGLLEGIMKGHLGQKYTGFLWSDQVVGNVSLRQKGDADKVSGCTSFTGEGGEQRSFFRREKHALESSAA